jgi:membrane dipeptidase
MDPEARRRFIKSLGALALSFGHPGLARAGADLPIADAHSHVGMFAKRPAGASLKAEMAASGVTLLSWNIVGDGRWTMATSHGIRQRVVPGSGEQAAYFRDRMSAMRRALDAMGLAYVRGPSDIDVARAGTPHVVIGVEGAGFAADGLGLLDQYYAEGLRHLQLVHYIHNALGDFQTEPPVHDGLTALGADVVKACNRLGILVDLAHATDSVIDRTLEVSAAPVIWSHSALTTAAYTWQQPARLARLLNTGQARKIARHGGAVGLWSLRGSVGTSPEGYADELLRMVDALGPAHVMFGTDLDGVGRNGVMDGLGDLRKVADLLLRRGVDEAMLKAVCFENYARCLRAAMEAKRA